MSSTSRENLGSANAVSSSGTDLHLLGFQRPPAFPYSTTLVGRAVPDDLRQVFTPSRILFTWFITSHRCSYPMLWQLTRTSASGTDRNTADLI